MPTSETFGLIPSISIDAFLAKRDAINERVRNAAKLMGEATDIASTLIGERPYVLRVETRHHRNFVDEVETVCKGVDAKLWAYLLDQSGLRSFLDATARKQWDDAITKLEVPALTVDNINATFSTLHQGRQAMFERGICELFRRLSWDYKTNCPRRLGKRVILRGVVDPSWSDRPSHGGCDVLEDLLRVMTILGNKPEPDHRSSAWRKLSDARWPGSGVFTFEDCFSVRGFKNGNAHVTFLNVELVEAMNRIIAKHNERVLPPAEGE
jgi:hypothetical protein